MKIIRTVDEYNENQKLKQNALKGCDKCPCCGEMGSRLEYIISGITNKEINGGICRSWYGRSDGTFSLLKSHNKHWNVECFTCYSCGA